MSSPGVSSGVPNRRQKRMGPAPFASFEDLSDEVRSNLDSPEDKAGSVVRLPGIREDVTPTTPAHHQEQAPEFLYTGISLVGAPVTPPSTTMSSLSTPQESLTSTKISLQTPSTPRIDISRASSSSQHEDSRDSTPERELFEGHDQGSAKLGLAFKEEGTLDLRSSTEELDFQDPQEKVKAKTRPQSPMLAEESLIQSHQRKDSQSSEIGLLSISGRTSRLSSIGSQGSAQSRVSNASRLSVISGQSGRSPSPHKMLLETSFCGTKPPVNAQQNVEQGTKPDSADELEKVLLSRKHDPREAILAEGISIEKRKKHPATIERQAATAKSPESYKIVQNTVKSDVTITVNNKPTSSDSNNPNKPKLARTFISPSGVEYIYIPLKGPLPEEDRRDALPKLKLREVRSANAQSRPQAKTKEAIKSKSRSTTSSPAVQKPRSAPSAHQADEPKYIRIKLKPDYMYDNEESGESSKAQDVQKPACLDLANEIQVAPAEPAGKSASNTPSASPKIISHPFPKDSTISSKSPSPSLSRKSSFASIFKSRETIISPDSPTIPSLKRKQTLTGIIKEATDTIRDRSRSRSRSKSRERDKSSSISLAPSSTESIDSAKSKQKSVLSIFKPKKSNRSKSDLENSSPEIITTVKSNIEFTFNAQKYYEAPLEGESIRIPLHSPTHYEERGILQELKSSSQDSQETVIDTTKAPEPVKEPVKKSESNISVSSKKSDCIQNNSNKNNFNKRQSSTSSENVVFSTNLGSDNEIFTTKLPKERTSDKTTKTPPKEETASVEVVTFNPDACEFPAFLTSGSQDGEKSSNADEDHYSSESERDTEADYFKAKKETEEKHEVEPERKGLVLQQDSFDDELPYIPTTLPLERSVAVPIMPIKQRGMIEMKTYPIERPRSTTPINPSCLEDYCEDVLGAINAESVSKTIEKLKISLPLEESRDKSSKIKSPRKGSGSSWFEFPEKARLPQKSSPPSQEVEESPPPLPPKGAPKEWINFEEIPERRKPPRRIQTIPSRGTIEVPESVLQENVVYNYVNPEDCKCECHDSARERERQAKMVEESARVQEDEVPLLEDENVEEEKSAQESVDRLKIDVSADRRSLVSDSSIDLSTSFENAEANGLEPSLGTPFTNDLGVSSNRSSVASQDEQPQSPDSAVVSPNAFPKTS